MDDTIKVLLVDDDPDYLREIASLNPNMLLLRVVWDPITKRRTIKIWDP